MCPLSMSKNNNAVVDGFSSFADKMAFSKGDIFRRSGSKILPGFGNQR